LARVTEPFFTTKAPGNGTGLGLAMAKGFAEQSGGGMGIRTAQGAGTRIDLWLPVAEGAAEVPQLVDPPGAVVNGNGKQILVVDDDKVFRHFIGEHLQLYGYAVATAENGAAALALLDDGGHIDLVVCDLAMSGINGIDLVGEIQRRRAGLPAILLTGIATQAAKLAATEMSGAFVLLHKPVSEGNLAAHVAMLLEAAEEG
jgi:CheY-like chemotaxis protein